MPELAQVISSLLRLSFFASLGLFAALIVKEYLDDRKPAHQRVRARRRERDRK